MRSFRMIVSYMFLITTIIMYIVISSYNYQLQLRNSELEDKIEELKESNDDISLEINMKNSRDNVLKDYPTLKFNNNTSNLQKESE